MKNVQEVIICYMVL